MSRQLGTLFTVLFWAGAAAAEPNLLTSMDAAPASPASVSPIVADAACGCETPRPWQLQVGYRTWFSWGNADDLVGGDSLFKFRNTYSTVYEFNVDAVWQRLVAHVDLGFGGLNGYFQSEDTSTNQTFGQIDIPEDGLFYVSADLGYRILERGDLACKGCALDLLAGYQLWRETYEPSLGGAPIFSDRYSWDSVRLGLRGVAVRDRLLLQGRFMVSPYAHFSSEATGFADPDDNYLIEADRSWGIMSDFSASYRLWRGLSIELGYQVFFLDSGPGTFNNEPGFNGSRQVRHGLLLGANWRF